MNMTPDKMPEDMHMLSKEFTPYVEVDIEDKYETLITSLLSGMFLLNNRPLPPPHRKSLWEESLRRANCQPILQ